MPTSILTVKFRTRVKRVPESTQPREEYELAGPIVPCCDAMAEYLRMGAVSFGDEPYHGKVLPRKDCGANRLSIFFSVADYRGEEELFHYDYPINFCPGCGARIDYVETERLYLVHQIVRETVEKVIYVEAEKPA